MAHDEDAEDAFSHGERAYRAKANCRMGAQSKQFRLSACSNLKDSGALFRGRRKPGPHRFLFSVRIIAVASG